MNRRKWTIGEKLVVLILISLMLASFYYLFLLKPVLGAIQANQLELARLSDERNVQMELTARKHRMVETLENSEGKLEGELVPYDNARNEMRELNRALVNSVSYDIHAEMPVVEDGIVRRRIQLSFQTETYEQAIEIVGAIEQGPYRCLISEAELAESETKQLVETRLWVTYFESESEESVGLERTGDVWDGEGYEWEK